MAESKAFRASLEWRCQFLIGEYSPLLPAIDDDVGWTRERLFEKSTKGGSAHKDGSAQNKTLLNLPVMTGAMDDRAGPIPHLP